MLGEGRRKEAREQACERASGLSLRANTPHCFPLRCIAPLPSRLSLRISIVSPNLSPLKAIQFAYTCIFGWYANFLHLRTGNLLAPLTAHVFCNIMGLPNPAGASKRHMQRKGVIYAAHLVGIVGFAWGIAAL